MFSRCLQIGLAIAVMVRAQASIWILGRWTITGNRYVQRKRQNDAIGWHTFVDNLEGGVYPVILSCLPLRFKDKCVIRGCLFFLSYHHKAFSSR